jgi:hypothetical protein
MVEDPGGEPDPDHTPQPVRPQEQHRPSIGKEQLIALGVESQNLAAQARKHLFDIAASIPKIPARMVHKRSASGSPAAWKVP